MLRRTALAAAALLAATALTACGGDGAGSGGDALVVYSGRAENLIKPLLDQLEKQAGIDLEVRYGGSAELAAQILEEGENRKADVFLSQDAGALGALGAEQLLEPLPPAALDAVPEKYRAKDGTWVGVSGRARAFIYNPELLAEKDLPKSVFDLVDPKWQGKIGIPPTNASFQAFVTAMRVVSGEDRTRAWLAGIKKNAKIYENNIQIRDAVDAGELPAGLVNHYYLYEKIAEVGADKVKARHYFFGNGDPGALVNVSGAGILKGTKRRADAEKFVQYMLGADAQRYYADRTKEYPLTAGVQPTAGLPPLDSIEGPDIDLSQLASLKATLDLLAEVGLT
ncbi:MAG TPA: iron ABC transporter substrate-binding protein [Frankiaceae bacterium]|nr:iron ABC transporter substrate-binding protein [Frankiaceae bacterium]